MEKNHKQRHKWCLLFAQCLLKHSNGSVSLMANSKAAGNEGRWGGGELVRLQEVEPHGERLRFFSFLKTFHLCHSSPQPILKTQTSWPKGYLSLSDGQHFPFNVKDQNLLPDSGIKSGYPFRVRGPGFKSLLAPAVGPVWAPRGRVPPLLQSLPIHCQIKAKSDLVRGGFDLKGGLQRGKGVIVSETVLWLYFCKRLEG